MVVVRILLGFLLGLLALVLALPAVILVDLVSGGTGLGLCQDGLATCSSGAFAGMELLIVTGGVVLVLGALIALCVGFLRRSRSADTPVAF